MPGFYYLAAIGLICGGVTYLTRDAPRGARRVIFYVLTPILVMMAMIALVMIGYRWGPSLHL